MPQVLTVPQEAEASQGAMELSIVVAADEAGPGLRQCLSALGSQVDAARMEVIVVNGSTRETTELAELPWVHVLRARAGTSVPRLWSAGIKAARGRIVALTIEQCAPAPNWASSVLRAHSAECAAVGGAMEPGAGLRLADWAIYFCRYSRYMLPAAPESLDDLAGDNCSYKRSALEGLSEVTAAGFWETFVHGAMRKRDQRLLFDPSVVVFYGGPIPFWEFLGRRWEHARLFAARRRGEMSGAERFARAVVSPLVSLVLLQRIAARVWKKRQHRGKLLACLPLLLGLLVSWAMGEGIGYLLGGQWDSPSEGAPQSLSEEK